MPTSALPPDLLQDLIRAGLETRADRVTRKLYSTDASLYQIEPLGVAFPRTPDHLNAAVELAAQYGLPIIARGSGSGLGGQAIGRGLILDCARYLDELLEVDPEAGTATVQPGMILDDFNRAVGVHGQQFGPDPASSERATLGGILGNNSTGAHSILYGMASDHIREIEVALADGSTARFGEVTVESGERLAGRGQRSTEQALYAAALDIRTNYAEAIRKNWAKVWRRASGYSLNYLLPWSASAPPQWSAAWGMAGDQYPPVRPGHINLAPLFVGSEGTLGVIRKAVVNLIKKPRHTILGVLAYDSIAAACDDTPRLLEFGPSAVELITRQIIQLSKAVPSYARLIDFLPPGEQDPAALLVVEFAGDSPEHLRERVKALGDKTYIAESAQAQARIWKVRKVGLGLLMSKPGNAQPIPFIEDVAVPVEQLGDFVREIDAICAEQQVEAAYYAHASAGCLHIRPILDLRSDRDVRGMRWIAERAIEAGLRMGGAVSGEHGDGLARSEWLEKAYGPEIMAAHRLLKDAADPRSLLNPGKIIDPPPMDQNLRFGSGYHARGWVPTLSFERQVSLENAIEMCNGAGVCRKLDGFMCPSFQATREEMHSTRGRANLLRALISGAWAGEMGEQPTTNYQPITTDDVYAALDLCLACKGCKSECPSGVDVAKLKYEFLEHYYQSRARKLRDYLFGNVGEFARLGAPFGKMVNWGMGNKVLSGAFSNLLKLAPKRNLPKFASLKLPVKQATTHSSLNTCLLLLDPFTQYFYPEDGKATIQVLQAAGFQVKVIPVSGAGRTLISKGFLKGAKKHARKVVDAIQQLDPDGCLPIVGVEPSEIYTLLDEYPDFFPTDDAVDSIARRAWMVDEFLLRQEGFLDFSHPPVSGPQSSVLLHGHCYQKSRPPVDDGLPTGVEATTSLLQKAGFEVEVVNSGCCGMAGAFGYEAEHFEVSMQIGELALFPTIRMAGEAVIIAAAGVSCQSQIEDGTQRKTVHPIRLVAAVLEGKHDDTPTH